MNKGELSKWMEWFVFEVRKKDGTKFQSLSLNHVVAGVMRHLRLNCKPELDFYKDAAFADFRQMLGAEMKRLKSAGETGRTHLSRGGGKTMNSWVTW